eukprot:CAMPEP_0174946028 /NCGR_PEP_ID=MMETSP1355-20121228/83095_1 /TAXON_ID=464990 /ORGANISM="Hemiselmis tepida, Strain CCMP443" /LENGTH=58 /DNA_ID=CAMNT_0016193433 /DNA_START=15 /DNA_END=188 /DNA_ORIENTATION=+
MVYKVLNDPKKRACFGKYKDKVEDLINSMAKRKATGAGQGKSDGDTGYQTSGFQHGKK